MYDFLDNDLYVFAMARGVFLTDPKKTVRYKLTIRNKNWERPYFNELFLEHFNYWFTNVYGKEAFSDNDLLFIADSLKIPFTDPYIKYLQKPKDVCGTIWTGIDEYNYFTLEYNGLWIDQILHEVPLLSAISELYYKLHDPVPLHKYKEKVVEQWSAVDPKIIEMGTRRRISFDHQEEAIKGLLSLNKLEGTSNLYFARKYNLPCFGSNAHQWYMAKGNEKGVKDWLSLGYKTNILLPDTFTTDKFFSYNAGGPEHTDLLKADGFRQDSGKPREFVDKVKKFYDTYKVNTKEKTIVFSDSLNVVSVNTLNSLYKDQFNVKFGVGSNITCIHDRPLKIVIKPTEFDGEQVFKISDDPEKSTK